MKTYNAKTRRSKELKQAIQNTLNYHERFVNFYFWTPPASAGGRRSGEKQFENGNPSYMIHTTMDGKEVEIEVKPNLSYSCKNVYYSLNIFMREKGGEYWEPKDIRVLKKLLK